MTMESAGENETVEQNGGKGCGIFGRETNGRMVGFPCVSAIEKREKGKGWGRQVTERKIKRESNRVGFRETMF